MKNNRKHFLLISLFALALFLNMDIVNAKVGTFACGGSIDLPLPLAKFSSNLFKAIKVLVPVILIVMSMVELLKNVMSGDDGEIKKNNKKIINRFIAGVAIFVTMSIVSLIFSLIGENSSLSCLSWFVNGKGAEKKVDYSSNLIDCSTKQQSECNKYDKCKWGMNDSCSSSMGCCIVNYGSTSVVCTTLSLENCSKFENCKVSGTSTSNPKCVKK